MASKNNKGTTLDDLANMVARGFEGVEQRMATKEEMATTKEEMNAGFREVNQRMAKVDSRVDDIYEILTRFEEGDILDLQNRIKILERTVKAMSKRLV